MLTCTPCQSRPSFQAGASSGALAMAAASNRLIMAQARRGEGGSWGSCDGFSGRCYVTVACCLHVATAASCCANAVRSVCMVDSAACRGPVDAYVFMCGDPSDPGGP